METDVRIFLSSSTRAILDISDFPVLLGIGDFCRMMRSLPPGINCFVRITCRSPSIGTEKTQQRANAPRSGQTGPPPATMVALNPAWLR
jgi:hypothetical protein